MVVASAAPHPKGQTGGTFLKRTLCARPMCGSRARAAALHGEIGPSRLLWPPLRVQPGPDAALAEEALHERPPPNAHGVPLRAWEPTRAPSSEARRPSSARRPRQGNKAPRSGCRARPFPSHEHRDTTTPSPRMDPCGDNIRQIADGAGCNVAARRRRRRSHLPPKIRGRATLHALNATGCPFIGLRANTTKPGKRRHCPTTCAHEPKSRQGHEVRTPTTPRRPCKQPRSSCSASHSSSSLSHGDSFMIMVFIRGMLPRLARRCHESRVEAAATTITTITTIS